MKKRKKRKIRKAIIKRNKAWEKERVAKAFRNYFVKKGVLK
ncbi:DUF3983 domain-containing protein [Bacillus sp. BP-3]|nr:DUF3983 domain-containing protein [Bacillus sp. BP-3]MDC2863773.1 DUF3983 domain-containing protein [Bacillus sp. BP-3]